MRRITRLLGPVLLALLVFAGPALAQSTFIFGAQGEPVDLDPAIITDGISSRITRQIYEGLTKYKGATTEVIPALAEKWTASADGTVWTFTLCRGGRGRHGPLCHHTISDGRPRPTRGLAHRLQLHASG